MVLCFTYAIRPLQTTNVVIYFDIYNSYFIYINGTKSIIKSYLCIVNGSTSHFSIYKRVFQQSFIQTFDSAIAYRIYNM